MPIDGWTIAHCAAGLFFLVAGTGRRLTYTLIIVWEIYQFYFHYVPQGYTPEDIGLNSMVDILVAILSYEIAKQYLVGIWRVAQWHGMNVYVPKIIGFIFLSLGTAWLFWDDVFRLHLSLDLPQIPLLLGAFAPVFVFFTTRAFLQNS